MFHVPSEAVVHIKESQRKPLNTPFPLHTPPPPTARAAPQTRSGAGGGFLLPKASHPFTVCPFCILFCPHGPLWGTCCIHMFLTRGLRLREVQQVLQGHTAGFVAELGSQTRLHSFPGAAGQSTPNWVVSKNASWRLQVQSQDVLGPHSLWGPGWAPPTLLQLLAVSSPARPPSNLCFSQLRVFSLGLCFQIFLLSSGHPSLDMGPTLIQDDLVLMTSAKSLFPNKVPITGMGD